MTDRTAQTDGFSMALLVEGGLGVLAVVLAWLLSVPLREQFPAGETLLWAVVRGVLATVPMLALFWWLVASQRPALRRLRQQVDWLVAELFPQATVAQLAVVALLAGVGEELLFRGVIQSLLVDWTESRIAGLVIASLLFGLAHALSKLYFAFATLIGLWFGWLALHYGDLVAPIVAHALYDFIALVYLVKWNGRRGRFPSHDVQHSQDDESANHQVDQLP